MEPISFIAEFRLVDTVPGYAEAATKNDLITWASFVFTDDQPNENKKRIPQTEFKNIIKSGIFMPIKMEGANPDGEHEKSSPIGVITNLKQEENKILGLSAFWNKEYPESVKALKEAQAGGKSLKLSWELLYDESQSLVDNNGIEDLMGTVVQGITFVGNPAYAGRTNVLALSEKEETTQEENELTDINSPDVAALEARMLELQTELDAVKAELQSRVAELDTASSELTSLREFKQAAEAESAKYEKTTKRRKMLKEAGVDYTDEEFETKKEKLIGLTDDDFDFLVQERVAFSSEAKKTTPAVAGILNTNIPDLTVANEKDQATLIREAFGLTGK